MGVEVVSSSDVVCLPLWSGSANDAPPTGWSQTTFDDALWPAAATATYAPGLGGPVSGTQAIWSDAVPRAQTDEVLFRHHFDLPADIISATIVLAADDYITEVYLNGASLSATAGLFAPGPTQSIPTGAFVAGGHNVLAIHGQNHNLFADPTNFGSAWISYLLLVMTSSDTGTTSGGSVATTGVYGPKLCPALRLVHPGGWLDWEHDGTLFRVRSGDKTVLQAPFPVMSGQPAALLGRDPQTGLPMWTGDQAAPPPPAPPPVSRTYSQVDRSLQDTSGAPTPLPTPPSARRVCGAAEAMADLACIIYDAIVQLINKAKADIIADFTQGLKAQISAELISLLTEAEFAQWAIDAVQLALIILEQIVETLINWGTSLPLIWPSNTLGHPTSQQFLFIRCAAWQSLWLTGGDYLSRSKSADGLGTKDYWRQYLAPQWSFFAGSTQSGISQSNPPWQLVWINAVIDRVSDLGWAFAAAKGAEQPSTGCTGCVGYPP